MTRQSPETPVEASIRSVVASPVSPDAQASTDALYYSTGHRIGQELSVNALDEIAARLNELGMGHLELVSRPPDPVVFHWFDCLTCSGLPTVGRPLCYLEAGILSGAVERASGHPVRVRETRCWGLGDTFCEMQVQPGDGTDQEVPPVPLSEDQLLVTVTLRAVQAAKLSRLRWQSSASATPRQPPPGAVGGLPSAVPGGPSPGAVGGMSPAAPGGLPPGALGSLSPAVPGGFALTAPGDLERGARPEFLGDLIFEGMPVPMALTDDRGRIVKANSSWQDLTGCTRAGEETHWLPRDRIERVLQAGQAEVWAPGRPATCDFLLMALPLFRGTSRVGALVQAFRVDSELTRLLVERVTELEGEARKYRIALERTTSAYARFGPLETTNPAMKEVLLLAARVSQTDATVLITGESGTGKEVLARAIHDASPRASRPFVKVDCTAVPEQLVESELFGYEEGAFTGARKGGKPGKLELARGGTLFLDEIGDLPVAVQAKLLRVVESREFERLGGTRTLRVDARIIVATNRDLHAMVRAGTFRADLLYRLEVVRINLPPLRERLEDLPLLVEAVLARLNRRYGKRVTLGPGCLDQLRCHAWPGNVRELENALERALIVCRGDQIIPDDLPDSAPSPTATPGGAGAAARGGTATPGGAAAAARGGAEAGPPNCWEAVAETERQVILRALSACGGNKTRAARMLGISRQALHAKMNRLGLRPP